MCWRNDLKVDLKGITPNFIDVIIDDGQQWRLTGFYGEPVWENKHLSWGYLRDLHELFRIPSVVLGDFNKILYMHEKEGGQQRAQRWMDITAAEQASSGGCKMPTSGGLGYGGRLPLTSRHY